jgi:hypothetical protein
MNYQSENRIFQVWDYTVSHGMLLIRSPGEGTQSTIDLVFHGTQFMSVPRHVGEISVHSADADARLALTSLWPKLADKDEVFVINSQGTNHYVVAAGMKVTEHHNGIFWNAFGDPKTVPG